MQSKRPLSYFARKQWDQQQNLSREVEAWDLAWTDAAREAALAAREASRKTGLSEEGVTANTSKELAAHHRIQADMAAAKGDTENATSHRTAQEAHEKAIALGAGDKEGRTPKVKVEKRVYADKHYLLPGQRDKHGRTFDGKGGMK